MLPIGKTCFKMKEKYIKLPLKEIPFSTIDLLKDISLEYINCSYIPLRQFNNTDICLMSVYSPFYKNSVEEKHLMFGRILTDVPYKRGLMRAIQVCEEEINIKKEELPHLKFSNNSNPISGNWFYTKDGDYFMFSGVKSTYQQVRHLEEMAVYGDNIVRLRVVIELLKSRMKDREIKLSLDELKLISFEVLRSNPTTKRISDIDIMYGVENWLPGMMDIPTIEEIPIMYRERVVTEDPS